MKKVLLIDDEPVVERLVGAALEAVGVESTLDYCSDGGEGRTRALEGDYDLVILDIKMPYLDGVQVLADIRSSPRAAGTPVVVLTGHYDPLLKQRVSELGAALIEKPIVSGDLGHMLRRWLEA